MNCLNNVSTSTTKSPKSRRYYLDAASGSELIQFSIADHYEDGAALVEKATDLLRNRFHFFEICIQVDTHKASMNHCSICNENKEITSRTGNVSV